MALTCSHPECFDYRECMHREQTMRDILNDCQRENDAMYKKPPAASLTSRVHSTPSIRGKRPNKYKDHVGRYNYNCNGLVHCGKEGNDRRWAYQCLFCSQYMRAESDCLPNYPVPATVSVEWVQYLDLIDTYLWNRTNN